MIAYLENVQASKPNKNLMYDVLQGCLAAWWDCGEG